MSKGQRLLSFLERAFVVSVVMAVLSAHRRFSQQKCCIMHESPVRRAAPQHPEVDVNGSFGLWFQLVAATQASNFSAGVWYCKVFLGRSLSWRATALSLA